MQYKENQCFGRADSGRPRVLDLLGLEHETCPGFKSVVHPANIKEYNDISRNIKKYNEIA